MTYRLFRSDRIPDVAYLIEGRLFDRHLHDISLGNAERKMFSDSDEVAIKREGSGQGRGVQFLSRKNFDPVALAASTANAVIQTRITQHPIFDTFVPRGAVTLRLTTVRELDATFHVRAAYLRIPYGNHKFVRSASSARVAVDLSSGALADSGYLSDWTAVIRHPESDTPFSGLSIPGFSDAVRVCQDLHATVPQVGCIGWDVILDGKSGAWILEWNADHNDVKFSEAVTGPCFRNLNWERLRPARYTWQL